MDTGTVVKSSGGKGRGFPWRLWLYAIVITGAAAGGGYLAWQYRDKKIAADHELEECNKRPGADVLAKCTKDLADTQTKSKQLEGQLTELGKGLNATKDELATLRAQKAEADKRMAAIEEIRSQFAKMISTGDLRITSRRGELVLSLPSGVLFPSGSAELSKKGEYTVVEVGAILKKFPKRRFLVVGHTDNQDFGKNKDQCAIKDNWQLSTERALTVTRVFVTAGMDAKNLLPSGAGEFDPIASNASEQSRQLNRRIEIALLPDISELPPLPAGLKEETSPTK